MTTTRLTIPRRRRWAWRDLSTPTLALLALASLLSVVFAVQVSRWWRMPAAAVAPTPAFSYILIATPVPTAIPPTIAPTAAPAPPTPDERVLEELAALRAQLADIQAAQAAPPPPAQVVYVEQPAPPPAAAAPTPAEPQYAVTSVDAAPTLPPQLPTFAPLAPQQAAILDRNAWAVDAAAHR